jgi:hypothetical protein
VESQRSRAGLLRGMYVCVAALGAALALVVAPASASAASPVLEFVSPSNAFPIPFTADGGAVSARLAEFDPVVECSGSKGEGKVAGPRSAFANYVFTGCVAVGGSENGNPCKSAGANAEEIKTGTLEAELVYVNQANHEVAMLLNPGGGVYMDFECGGESVKATGSFLSPVDPVNKLAPSFTAILRRNGASQLPSEYENANGEKRQAIPMGQKGIDPPDKTGVELTFTIHPSVPLEIKSVNRAEVEAKQRAEEAEKKRQAEEAEKKRLQEEAARKEAARKRHLGKALRQCKKLQPGHRRARCVKRAYKKHGAPRPVRTL